MTTNLRRTALRSAIAAQSGVNVHVMPPVNMERGRGYAAAAQTAWAKPLADSPNRLLIGTIDGLNTASRRTAERAGRPRVLDAVFVSLNP
jgi:hypothetical protein